MNRNTLSCFLGIAGIFAICTQVFAFSSNPVTYQISNEGTYTCSAGNPLCGPLSDLVPSNGFGTYTPSNGELNATLLGSAAFTANFAGRQGAGTGCYQWDMSAGSYAIENTNYCQGQSNNYLLVTFSGDMDASNNITGRKMIFHWNALGGAVTATSTYSGFILTPANS